MNLLYTQSLQLLTGNITQKLILKLYQNWLSKDPKVLNEIRMDRNCATYKLKHGLAVDIHNRLVEELRRLGWRGPELMVGVLSTPNLVILLPTT